MQGHQSEGEDMLVALLLAKTTKDAVMFSEVDHKHTRPGSELKSKC